MKMSDFCRDLLERVQDVQGQLEQMERVVSDQIHAGNNSGHGPVFLDLLDLSDSLRSIVLEVNRLEEATLTQIVQSIGGDRKQVQTQVETLVHRGYLEKCKEGDAVVYRVPYGVKRPRSLPNSVWDALEQRIQEQAAL